jgi:hypothetical protein
MQLPAISVSGEYCSASQISVFAVFDMASKCSDMTRELLDEMAPDTQEIEWRSEITFGIGVGVFSSRL